MLKFDTFSLPFLNNNFDVQIIYIGCETGYLFWLFSLDSDVLQKNAQIVWMFDVTRYKYCDADSGGEEYLKMNVDLDLDRWIHASDIHAQQRDLKCDPVANENLMFSLFATNSFPAGTALHQVS